ncbi:PAS domain S-box protein [Phenylobacterium sp.]|uniref:PAS domain S-box protein n=1 Tax=Phenylobacterium sp. TaxID=1871053 RepID=UPI002F9354F5
MPTISPALHRPIAIEPLDFSEVGVWTWDAKSDDVQFSEAGYRIFGLAEGTPITWTELQERLLHPEDAPKASAAVAAAVDQRDQYRIEYRITTPAGELRWILASGRPSYDDQGSVLGMRGRVEDVTERKQEQLALAEEVRSLEIINSTGALVASEFDLDRIVQAVVDAGVSLTGAQFGAFFYNVLREDGGAYMLYALSGAPRSAFETFGMPRATPVFHPTFAGEGIVRSDDITKDVRYGKMGPHHGMPEGHLPVRSYLAVPVASRSGEIIGGLFFGHSEPAQFDARDERVMIGIAAQAAIAVDNARLYQAAQEELRRRTEIEAALRDSEEFLRLILNSAPAGFYAVDNEGVTTVCNPAFLRILGFESADAAVGRKLHDLIHHTHPDGSHYPKEECPIYIAAAGGGAAHVPDENFFKLDGTAVPVEYWVEPLVRDGRNAGAICIFNDITERKAAQATQSRFAEELAEQVEARTAERDRMWRLSAELMLVADFEATIVSANPAWETALGWAPEELHGRKFLDLVHPDDVEPTLKEVGRLSEGATTFSFENRYQHKDGGYRCLSWTAVPDQGFIHAVARDVTAERDAAEALRRTEEALRQAQKMEAVGQLTGGVAHDFNNMLAIVIGSLDLARRRLDRGQPGAERYLEAAHEGASRAASLTQRLLAFSRQQPLTPRVTSLNKLVGGMSELLRRTLGETVEIETVLAGGLWLANVDPNQLESAILNLAVNARDAMPDGGQLTIETANAHLDDQYVRDHIGLSAGQYVMLAVSDKGHGMPADVVAKVFDPFFTTKPVGKGTGLGLSMVYGFVKQSGGHVSVYSEVGQGTTVKIYFPRHVGAAEDMPSTITARPAPDGTGTEVVLVVEDEERVRAMSVDALKELGYIVYQAGSGDEALRVIDTLKRLDLVFTDIVMAGMTGRQLADRIRAQAPHVKVLYTTGYTRNAVVHNGVVDAGVDFLPKPFSIADLARKVRAVLDKEQPR